MNIKSHISSIILLLMFIPMLVSRAQTPQKHDKGIYKSEDSKVYVNKAVPIYLSISMNSDGSDGEVLDGEDPTYSSPMYLDSEGYNSIRSPWKVDPETGKTVYPKSEVVFVVYADSQAPKSKIEFGDQQAVETETGTMIKNSSFALSATDAMSGVNAIYYSLDKSPFQKYSSPIDLPAEKSYSLSYYAVDNVGNVEEVQQINLSLDTTPPTTALSFEGDLSEKNISPRSTISLSANDNISGVKKVFFTLDDGKTYEYNSEIVLSGLSEGEHTITYFAVDQVNNNEEKKTESFYMDKSAPRVIDEVIGNTFIANGKEYYSGRTKLKLVAMDNKSGVKEISYSVNGGEYKPYTEAFYLSQAGDLNIEVLALDKVNNQVRTSAFSGKDQLRSYVDLSGPSLSYSTEGPSFMVNDTLFINKESRIRLAGKDNDSGFKEIDYQIDGGTSQTYSNPFNIEQDGFHRISYNGYDNLDNSSAENILCIVDNQGPEVFTRFSIENKKTKTVEGTTLPVYPPHVLLFLSSTDQYSGLDKISYSVNGGATQSYRSLIENFSKNKLYTIVITVTDKLGNENQEEISFYVE